MGTSSVVFRKDSDNNQVMTDMLFVLRATFAVSENGGTISRTVINGTLARLGIEGRSKTHTATIAVKPALKENIKPMRPAPVAKAASGFMNFGRTAADPILRTSLGTIDIGVVSPNLRHAQAGTDADASANVESLVDIAPRAASTEPIANPVTFSGNFDFVKTLALAADCDAGTSVTYIPVPSTDETRPRDVTTFPEARADDPGTSDDESADALHLCLGVDGETAIPPTDTYKVTMSYKGLTSAAFPPAGGESELAGIERDGTTFRIPYITTADGYHQRFVDREPRQRDHLPLRRVRSGRWRDGGRRHEGRRRPSARDDGAESVRCRGHHRWEPGCRHTLDRGPSKQHRRGRSAGQHRGGPFGRYCLSDGGGELTGMA